MRKRDWPFMVQPVDETTPEFRDMHFSDLVCSGAEQAVYINGLPEMPVRGIDFSHCTFTSRKDAQVQYAEGISFRDVTVNGKSL